VGEEKLMSQREAQRLAVLGEVVAGRVKVRQAAASLGVSERQVKRLTRRLREEGFAGLISKKRGAPSNRCIAPEVRNRYIGLVREHYSDFGPTLACEYLQRDHGFTYSVETLRGWMSEEQLWKPKQRRRVRLHRPRPRRGCRGELVQIDGSHHDWFEGRAAKCCLIAFIDDATGQVLAARFFATETTQGYLGLLQAHVAVHGLPGAFYSDRHSIFTKHDPENPKPTQFERALLQLDIEGICARTPQAKGRVERLFQTLQDRMVKAMRLQAISGIEAANAWLGGYLAQHNERFAVRPASLADAHRPWLGTPEQLGRICSVHHQRNLGNQLSCQFEGDIVQLESQQAGSPGGRAVVDIAQYADGRIEVLYRGQPLRHRRFTAHAHLKVAKLADDKVLNARVDTALDKQRSALTRLLAAIEHQDAQRQQGIRTPPAPANAPPRGFRPRPEPAQPSPA
jgi:transposase